MFNAQGLFQIKTEKYYEAFLETPFWKTNWSMKLNANLQVMIRYQHKGYCIGHILMEIMKKQRNINPKVLVTNLDVYIKPEEEMVYYVVKDVEPENYRISLNTRE